MASRRDSLNDEHLGLSALLSVLCYVYLYITKYWLSVTLKQTSLQSIRVSAYTHPKTSASNPYLRHENPHFRDEIV